jgi:aryl sulfotransferase
MAHSIGSSGVMVSNEAVGQGRNAWGDIPLVVRNHTLDSTRWDSFVPRDGDVIIANWGKSGTTWLQQIASELILGDCSKGSLNQVSPWIENRFVPLDTMLEVLESQTHRRFMKSHLPADALVFRPSTRYIYIGRDGRDAVWSWRNHHLKLRSTIYDDMKKVSGNDGFDLEPPSGDARAYFLKWLEDDGYPLWPFFSHVRLWWSLRHLPNVLVIHFEDLKRDLEGSAGKIARFLGQDVSPAEIRRIGSRASFSFMKAHARELLPEHDRMMDGGAETFINRGEGGEWQTLLRPEDIAAYESRMLSELDEECARWLSRPYSIDASPTTKPAGIKK